MTGGASSRHRLQIWLIAAGLIALAGAFLLFRGPPSGIDREGDVRQLEAGEGADPNLVRSADLTAANVTRRGKTLSFEVSTAQPLPRQIGSGSLQIRFDLSSEGRPLWSLAAVLDDGLHATLFSQSTGFGASTRDGTLPGSVEVREERIIMDLDLTAIELPDEFGWHVTSSLVVDPGGRFEDRLPDQGAESFP
jgi:hypothetical protein